jgi:hypothetical protein
MYEDLPEVVLDIRLELGFSKYMVGDKIFYQEYRKNETVSWYSEVLEISNIPGYYLIYGTEHYGFSLGVISTKPKSLDVLDITKNYMWVEDKYFKLCI